MIFKLIQTAFEPPSPRPPFGRGRLTLVNLTRDFLLSGAEPDNVIQRYLLHAGVYNY